MVFACPEDILLYSRILKVCLNMGRNCIVSISSINNNNNNNQRIYCKARFSPTVLRKAFLQLWWWISTSSGQLFGSVVSTRLAARLQLHPVAVSSVNCCTHKSYVNVSSPTTHDNFHIITPSTRDVFIF